MTTVTGHSRSDRRLRDSHNAVLSWFWGDERIQDKILSPETIRMVLDGLAQYAGDLAYTPEMEARAGEMLEQKFETDIGNDAFYAPNYAPYVDPNMAAFYGIKGMGDVPSRKETFQEQQERLVKECVRALEPELAGLARMHQHFANESWARHGIANEALFVHDDPDVTLFRNPEKKWSSIDIAVSTSDKSNVVNLYESVPDYVFPVQHPAWMVDKPNGYWSQLG